MPIPYDFTPGDNLLSALKQASQKLQDFITLRGKLAQADLTYQVVSGTLQGWVGKAYNDWAGQFNRSQNALNDYVDELNFHAVNVNNMLDDTELRIYHRTQRIQLPAPPPPPPPIQAPGNNVILKVNTEGATPTCLYAYSDQTTGSNDRIRPFFRFTLPGAAGAFSPPGPPQYTSSTNSGKSLGTVQQVAQAITDFLRLHILLLDARVRLAGEAFEKADNTGYTSPGFHTIHDPTALNHMVNQIAKNASQDAKDGANTARQFKEGTPDPGLPAQLAAHQDDPVWTSAFFSNLSPADVQRILEALSMFPPEARNGAVSSFAQAYATWLASDNTPDPAISNLILKYLTSNTGREFGLDSYLFQDLKNDPAAGAKFLNTATDAQLLQMLNGPDAPQLIDVFTSVLSSEPNVADANTFYNRFGNMILGSQPLDAGEVFGPVQRFLSAYITLTLQPPPTGDDSTAIQNDWIPQVTKTLSALEWGPDGKSGWHSWLAGAESANQQMLSDEQALSGLFLGALSAALLGELTLAFPALAPITIQVIASTIMSVGTNWVTSQVTPGGPQPPDAETLDDYVRYTAAYLVAANLLASGKVTQGGQVVPPPTNEQDLKSIINNATQYYVADSGMTLDSAMGSTKGHINSPNEKLTYSH